MAFAEVCPSQNQLVTDRRICVAGNEQDVDLRLTRSQVSCQFWPAHTGHHHITDQQVDSMPALLEHDKMVRVRFEGHVGAIVEAGASLTAIGAARMRAAHLLLDDDPKIFRDDFALRFSGCDSEASFREDTSTPLAEIAAKVGPEIAQRVLQAGRALMIMRSRYTEDALNRSRGVTPS
jgi:hypothetical protein